tara:strand:+ start:1376 stop:2986 length:1611 start_codon:yes stop_codon:yes gene_type:complete
MEGEMMDAVTAPSSVQYGDQLPLGIEAKSQKRMFFPTTGDAYSAAGNNICRIDINYDGLLDTAQSYLEFTLTNDAGAAGSLDLGQAAIKKLTVSSGGVVLEEIHDYNTLVGAFLLPSNAGKQNLHYESMNLTGIDFAANFSSRSIAEVTADIVAGNAAGNAATRFGDFAIGDIADCADNAATRAAIFAALNLALKGAGPAAGLPLLPDNATNCVFVNALRAAVNAYASNDANGTFETLRYSATTGAVNDNTGAIQNGGVRKQHYKLVSGLLDNDKYLPLVLMNAGITLEIEFAPVNEVGCCVGRDFSYAITQVRYAAHLIDLERSFYDRLRMVQQASGGVLQIAGQSYRGFRGTIDDGTGQGAINCPARVRSIKSFFFGYKRSVTQSKFNTSAMGHNNLTQFQLSIGATRYPPTANECSATSNKVGAYTELMKAFGKVGSTVHSDLLNGGNYMVGAGAAADSDPSARIPFSPFAIDLESFRHEIENGIDSSSRALPITLHTTHTGNITAGCNDVYMYVLYDSLFYVNMDGSVSVSS